MILLTLFGLAAITIAISSLEWTRPGSVLFQNLDDVLGVKIVQALLTKSFPVKWISCE